jgi:hypothetical protein
MNTQQLLKRAEQNGCSFEATCVGIGIGKWEELMKGATRANRKLAVKIALLAGAIDEQQAREEIKRPYFNPYNHYKTKTHLIYIHSSIEHFIRIH